MLEAIFDFIAGIIGIFIAIGLIAFPVMWIWNYTLVSMFVLPHISYVNAMLITVLCDLLFKGNIGMRVVNNGKD